MKRFDFSEELTRAMVDIRDTLDTYNPKHPLMVENIEAVLRWYGTQVEKAWSTHHVDTTAQMAREGTSNMLSALLVGTEPLRLVVSGEYDDRMYFIVRGAKDDEDAMEQVRAWYKENFAGGWMEDIMRVEELKIKDGVTRL